MEQKVLFTASRASHLLRFHRPYLKYFHELGYQVHTVSQGAVSVPEVTKTFDLPFVKNPTSPINLKTLAKLKSIIQTENYHTIICNATLAGLLTRVAAKQSSVYIPRFIYISHGYLFNSNDSIGSRIKLQFEKAAADVVDELIVMNEEDFGIAKKHNLAKSIYKIPGMGLCPELFPKVSPTTLLEERKKMGYSVIDFIILSVGEFSKRKNQMQLLKALTLLEDIPQIKVVFAGDGGLLDECRRFADKHKLSERTSFLGEISNLNRLYRLSNILAATSHSEGLPFNVMESLYCGLPVIATRVKGHLDLLQENYNSLLFDDDSPKELAQKIRDVYQDVHLYNTLKRNARLPKSYQIENTLPIVVERYGLPVPAVAKTPIYAASYSH